MEQKGANIVLITIDCFRKDALEYMPFIKGLIKYGLYFKNAYSPSTCTYYSFPSMFSGKNALLTSSFGLPKNNNLISFLKSSGYITLGINGANPWLSKFYGYGDVFDYYEDFIIINKNKTKKQSIFYKNLIKKVKKKIGFVLSDRYKIYFSTILKYFKLRKGNSENWIFFDAEKINRKIDDYLSNISTKYNKSKFFWLHFMDLHEPYYTKMPPNLYEVYLNIKINYELKNSNKNKKVTIEKIKELYLQKAEKLDSEIRKIFEKLNKWGLTSNNTIFIITGDHGQEFLENGYLYHHSYKSFHKILTNVPLIVYGKGLKARVIEETFSLNSLSKLILNLISGQFNEKIFNKDIALVVRPSKESINANVFLKEIPNDFYEEIKGVCYYKNKQLADFVIRNFTLKELKFCLNIDSNLKENVEKKINEYVKELKILNKKKDLESKIKSLKEKSKSKNRENV